ncbi:hypothetical protein LG307_14905 [Sutcliffiella horikoshii]|uniref:hypothetical protein n=1 Tax=Sutcliffiella horikoshii TaxID=79883 RepID=UPI00384E44BC
MTNEQLIKNLEFSIASIKPNGHYHLNIPEELSKDIANIKARLREYETKINPAPPKNELVAMITMKDASCQVIDVHSSGNITAEEVSNAIIFALNKGIDSVKIGCTSIKVDDVWQVTDGMNKKSVVINPANDPHLIPISSENMTKFSDNALRDSINILLELIDNEDDEDIRGEYTSVTYDAVDELEERFLNARYEYERLDNILFSFMAENGLYQLFENHIEQLKVLQNDPNDKYEVADELYGDLDEFMSKRSHLKVNFSE